MPNPFARSALRWIPVVNIDTEPAPPFGLLGAAGVDSLGRIQVKRPTMSSQTGLLVNGPGQIPAGYAGQAHQTWPAIVAYDDSADDSGDPPAAGEQWGSLVDGIHNAWKLAPGQSGFAILGGAAYGRVMATAAGVMQSFAAISSSSTSTVQLFDGTLIAAYPAHLQQSYTGVSPPATPAGPQWTNAAASVWLVGINGETLSTGTQYACLYIGQDVNGVGIWAPAIGSTSQELEAGAASVSLSSSWANISGMSIVLPPGQKWKATATITATITSSASGAFDSVSFRLMDSNSAQWGRTMTGCNVVCDGISFTDFVGLQGTGVGGVTLNVQGMISTSSGSTANMVEGSIIATTL